MKRLIRKLEEYENRQKQYRLEKDELDKKHGKYKSPKKRWGMAALGLSVKVFIIVAHIPIIAGIYLLTSNENMGFGPLRAIHGNGFENAFLGSFDRSEECRNLDGVQYPEKKSACLVEQMNQGDMFMGDLIAVLSAVDHALETRDKKLAENALASIERMENYRHYDDINLDQDIGRAFDMMTDSILFIPVRPFLDDDSTIFSVDKNTFVEKKMDILKEQRAELIEAFDL